MTIKSIEASIEGLEELERMFNADVVAKGVNSAINKITRKGVTQGVKKTRLVYNVKAADLKRKIKVHKSTRRTLFSTIIIIGTRLNLIAYSGTRQIKKGVSYMVKRGERKLRRSAFIAPISGEDQVLRRRGKKRLPIISQTAKGPVGMFEDVGLKEVDRLIDNELGDLIIKETIFFQSKER